MNKKSKTEITVITDFNGDVNSGKLVERVMRTTQKFMVGEGSDKRTQRGKHYVSYKGKRYITFILGNVYGDIQGLCISI